MQNGHVDVVEDDDSIRDNLSELLKFAGYRVRAWRDALSFLDNLPQTAPAVVVTDMRMPGLSGLQMHHELVERGRSMPVIYISGESSVSDSISAMKLGAVDFLVKPFAPEELSARLRAVGRRRAGAAAARQQIGAVEVDVGAKAVWLQGDRVDLTAREWAVLEALVLRAGRIVPKSELERLVLGFEAELASNALEVHVSALRRKLGRSLIETVRGLGYRIPA